LARTLITAGFATSTALAKPPASTGDVNHVGRFCINDALKPTVSIATADPIEHAITIADTPHLLRAQPILRTDKQSSAMTILHRLRNVSPPIAERRCPHKPFVSPEPSVPFRLLEEAHYACTIPDPPGQGGKALVE
jgi:hypothetical protein